MTEEYKRMVDEVRQVVSGRRGWVGLTKARAVKCGCSHGSLIVLARAAGLTVTTHGKHGTCGVKFTKQIDENGEVTATLERC